MSRPTLTQTRSSPAPFVVLASLVLLLAGLLAAPPAHASDTRTQAADTTADASDASYSRDKGDMDKPITPDEAVARAYDWIDKGLTYDQGGFHPDRHDVRYRTDCSGSVTMAWHAKPVYNRGYTTVTIFEVAHEIGWDELQPGDAVWKDGHIEMVNKIDGDQVELFSFGRTPARAETHTKQGVMFQYSKALRYDQMEAVTEEKVRDTIEDSVTEQVETQPEIKPQMDPPNGETITNFGTVFHSGVEPYNETVTMGATEVQVAADPTHFLWDFDDGRTKPSNGPGTSWDGPPDELIKHEYDEVGTFHPFVQITWGNYRYRIQGEDEWEYIDGEIVLQSPPSEITVQELHSVLRDGDAN